MGQVNHVMNTQPYGKTGRGMLPTEKKAKVPEKEYLGSGQCLKEKDRREEKVNVLT